MAETYTTLLNKLDVSFDASETHQYGLAVVFSETEFSFCINDLKHGRYLGLSHMIRNDVLPGFGSSENKPTFTEFLNELVSNVSYLKNDYKLSKIAFEGARSTLIPAKLYDPSEALGYLDFTYGKSAGDPLFSDRLVNLDAFQVSTLSSHMVHSIETCFPGRRMVNSASVFIESIMTNYKNRLHKPEVFLNLRYRQMDLAVFNGHQMTYFNSFTHQCPEDIIYYMIFVLEQLNLNPEEISVILYGGTGQDEGLMDLLNIYVRHVEFGKRNTFFKYSHVLNDIPAHAHYSLLNLLSCGL